jgi:hypothetical protein
LLQTWACFRIVESVVIYPFFEIFGSEESRKKAVTS